MASLPKRRLNLPKSRAKVLGNPAKPIRSCLVCRGKQNKGEFLRVVFDSGELVLDREFKMQGRGAYLHRGCCLKLPAVEVWCRAFRLDRGVITKETVSQFRTTLAEIEKEVLKV